MRSPIEVVDKKIILPLSTLRTEFGLAFLYFGLLLGIKASDILDNPWLLGIWLILFWGILFLDLARPRMNASSYGSSKIGHATDSRKEENIKGKKKNRVRLQRFGIVLASICITLLIMNFSEAFFFRIESLFRIVHFGDSLANWVLLSFILVVTNMLGTLASLGKTDTAPFARLFPILALGIVYLKGVI